MKPWNPIRDTPVTVKEAWDILYRLNPSLKQYGTGFPSDTAQRILNGLADFSEKYAEHFLQFVKEEEDGAVLAQTTPPRPGQLRRNVGPLLQLKIRLDAAMSAAEKEVEAYDLEGMSLSLRANQQEVIASKGESESEEEAISTNVTDSPFTPQTPRYTRLSPSKRPSEHTETTLTKRFRSIAPPDTLQKPLIGPVRPPLAHAGASTSTIDTSTTSIFTNDATVSSPTTSTDTPVVGAHIDEEAENGRWRPLPERSEDEQYMLITPSHEYHAAALKHCHLHTLMELQIEMDRHNFTYDHDFVMDDVMLLAGPSVKGAARIPDVLRNICLRKGMVEKAETLGRYDTDRAMSRAREQADAEEEVLARQEARAKRGKRKAGNDSENQELCEGKIVYSFTLQYTGKKAKSETDIGHKIEPSLADSITNPHEAGPSRSHPGERKIIDEPSNPFGQLAKTREAKSQKDRYPFIAKCRPPQMTGKSFRLIRRYGSRRVIAFKVPKNAGEEDLRALFEGTVLMVFGRPFRALWATPDGGQVFAIETNDALPKRFAPVPKSAMLSSLDGYLSRFNDLSQKPEQAMAKWGSRPQILLSDSVPALRLSTEAVTIIPDIVSAHASDPDDPLTEEIMTDGCGLMRHDIATYLFGHLIQRGVNPHSPSTAIQMRFGGSKGMLALMSPEEELRYPDKSLVLRQSMVKSLADPKFSSDIAMTTLDLVRFESLRVEVALTPEPMPILVDRGVPQSVLVKLQQNLLEELKTAFSTTPNGDESVEQAEHRLRSNVYSLGGVGQDAKKRSCSAQGTSHRVAGLTWKDESDEEGEESDIGSPYTSQGGMSLGGCMTRYDIDPISGQPNSVAESLYQVLCAGYHPTRSAYAADKLRSLVKTQCEAIVNRFRLPVKQSLSAFIIPDTSGVLAPDELYICADDRPPIDPITQTPTPTLLGPVLALRNPCKLPTDIRKLTAVYRSELAHLRNVIVMSANATLCRQSPASLLSGGDYDGDVVQLFWDPDLVGAFTNADEALAAAPKDFVQENFVKEVVKGTEVLEATEDMSDEGKVRNLQRFLLGGLGGDGLTGKYSDWHGNAQYRLGVSHPETIRLGRMFCHVLDARKSGLRVKPEILKQDAKDYSGEMAWRCARKGLDFHREGSMGVARSRNLGKYIMDKLHRVGKGRIAGVLASFPEHGDAPTIESMDDYNALSAMFKSVKSDLQRSKGEYDTLCANLRQANMNTDLPALNRLYPDRSAELTLLIRHVLACYKVWHKLIHCGATSQHSISQQYTNFLEQGQIPSTPKREPAFGSPMKSSAELGSEIKARRTMTRELALIWRDQVQVELIQTLCPSGLAGEEWLRELKISIGSTMGQMQNKQKFIFDMDFRTACTLRAKNSGKGSVTMLEKAWSESRPTRQALI